MEKAAFSNYACCAQKFQKISDLIAHLKSHHTVIDKTEPRPKNDTTTVKILPPALQKPETGASSSSTSKDNITHTLVENKNVCDLNSSSSISRVVQIIDNSTDELERGGKLYRCSECDFVSDYGNSCYAHMRNKHRGFTIKRKYDERSPNVKKKMVTIVYTPVEKLKEGAKRYKCSACDLTSDDTASLYRHMESEHERFTMKRKEGIASSLWEEVDLMNKRTLGNTMKVEHTGSVVKKKGPIINSLSFDGKKRCENVKAVSVDQDKMDDPGRIMCDEKGEEIDNVENLVENYTGTKESPDNAAVRLDRAINNYVQGSVETADAARSLIYLSSQDTLKRNVNSQQDPTDHSHSTDKIVTVIRNSLLSRLNGEPAYRCSECNKASMSTSQLYKHMRFRHKEFKIKFLTSRKTFKRVVKSTFEEIAKGFHSYRCSLCDTSSEQRAELYEHIRVAHPDVSIRKSTVGKKRSEDVEIPDIDKRVRPIKVMTKVGIRYKCSQCTTILITLSCFWRHARKYHKGVYLALSRAYRPRQLQHTQAKRKASRVAGDSNVQAMDYHGEDVQKVATTERNCQQKNAIIRSGKFVRAINIHHDRIKCLYKCSLCTKTNIGTANIYKHMRSKHKEYHILKHTQTERVQVELNGPDINFGKGSAGDSEKTDELAMPTDINLEGRYTGKDSLRYQCSECIYTSNRASRVHTHMRNVHYDFTIVKMTTRNTRSRDVCTKDIDNDLNECIGGSSSAPHDDFDSRLGNDSVHIVENPNRKDRFKCSRCDFSYHHISVLYTHIRHIHGHQEGLKSALSNEKRAKVVYRIDSFEKESEPRFEKAVCIIHVPRLNYHQYKCSECDRTSYSSSIIYKHMERRHIGFKIVENDNRQNETNQSYLDEGASEVIETPSNENDRQDGTSFVGVHETSDNDENRNKVHIISFQKVKESYFTCSECDETSKSRNDLYDHVQCKHKGFKLLQHFEVKRMMNVLPHFEVDMQGSSDDEADAKTVQVVHLPVPISHQYKCSECDKTSNSTSGLYKHMAYHHKGYRIIKKTELKKERNQSVVSENQCQDNENWIPGSDEPVLSKEDTNKTVHIVDFPSVRTHPYKCSECDKTSDSTTALYKHMKLHHKGFKIMKVSEIKRAEAKCHDGEIKRQTVQIIDISTVGKFRYKCSECETFSNNTTVLYRHMMRKHRDFEIFTKSEKKKKQTVVWNEGAKTVQIMDRPLVVRTHQYKCSGCDKTSNCTSVLYYHMERDHEFHRIIKKRDMKKMTSCSSRPENGEVSVGGGDKEGMSIEDKREHWDENGKRKTVQIIDIPVTVSHQYECSECGLTSDSTSNLYKHMKRHHKGFNIITKTDVKKNKNESLWRKSLSSNLKKNDTALTCGEGEGAKTIQIIDRPVVKKNKNESLCTNDIETPVSDDEKGQHKVGEKEKTSDDLEYNPGSGSITNDSNFCSGNDDIAPNTRVRRTSLSSNLKKKAAALTCGEGEGAKTVEIIDRHVEKTHQFKCSECDKTSHTVSALYNHMEHYHKYHRIIKESDMRKMRSASGTPENDEELISSDKRNSIKDDGEYWDEDGKRKTVQIIDIPVAVSHQYECSECGLTSNSTSNLYRHMKRQHKSFKIITKTDVKKNKNSSLCTDDIETPVSDDEKGPHKVGEKEKNADDPEFNPGSGSITNDSNFCSGNDDIALNTRVRRKGLKRILKKNDTALTCSCREGERAKTVQIIDRPVVKKNQNESLCTDDIETPVSDIASNTRVRRKGLSSYLKKNDTALTCGEGEGAKTVQIIDRPVVKKNKNLSLCTDDIETPANEDEKGRHKVGEKEKNADDQEFNPDSGSITNENIPCSGNDDTASHTRESEEDVSDNELMEDSDVTQGERSVIGEDHKGHKIQGTATDSRLNVSVNREDNADDMAKDKGLTATQERPDNGKQKYTGHRIILKKKEAVVTCDDEGTKIVQIIDLPMVKTRLYKCSECDKTSDFIGILYKHMEHDHKFHKIINKRDMKKKKNAENNEILVSSDEEGLMIEDDQEYWDENGKRKTVQILDVPTKINHPYKCSECNFTSDFTSTLYNHMRRRHKGFKVVTKTDIKKNKNLSLCTDTNDISISFCSGIDDTDTNTTSHTRESEEDVNDIEQLEDSSVTQGERSVVGKDRKGHNIQGTTANIGFNVSSKNEVNVGDTEQVEGLTSEGEGAKTVQILDLPVVRSHQYKCSECDKTSDSTGILYKHMEHAHKYHRIIKKSDMKKLRPALCTSGNNDRLVSSHEERASDDDNGERKTVQIVDIPVAVSHQYKCSECDQTSSCTSTLYNHMRARHKGFKIITKTDVRIEKNKCTSDIPPERIEISCYECCECMETFSSFDELDSHAKIHEIENSDRQRNSNSSQTHRLFPYFYCPPFQELGKTLCKCVKCVKSGGAYKESVCLIDLPRGASHKYKCSYCDDVSNQPTTLYKHMERHHRHLRTIRRNEMWENIIASLLCNKDVDQNTGNGNADLPSRPFRVIHVSENGKQLYKCSECFGIVRRRLTDIVKHMRAEHKDYLLQYKQFFEETVRDGASHTEQVNVVRKTDLHDYANVSASSRVVRMIAVFKNGKYFYRCSLCFCLRSERGNMYKHMRQKHKRYKIIKWDGEKARDDNECGSEKPEDVQVQDTEGDDMHAYLRFKDDVLDNVDDDSDSVVEETNESNTSKSTSLGFTSYECCVCMEVFHSTNELDKHVQSHERKDATNSDRPSIFDYQ